MMLSTVTTNGGLALGLIFVLNVAGVTLNDKQHLLALGHMLWTM